MTRPEPLAPRGGDLVWVAVSLLALVPCLHYPYRSQVPDPGFTLLPGTWEVVRLRPCPPASDCPRNGDRVLAIDELTAEAFRADRRLELLAPFAGDGRARVRLVRAGVERTVEVRLVEDDLHLGRLLLVVSLPAVFWLMGTVLVIFLRPRDERWLAMTLFSYVTALVLASGMASSRHAAGSAVVFHVVVWLFLPIALHLHLLLPSPLLGRGRRPLLVLVYGSSLLLVALDARALLAPLQLLHVLSFAGGIGLSLGLLGLRLALPAAPAVKVANRIMAFGIAVGFAPVVTFFLVLPYLVARRGDLAPSGIPLEPWVLALSLLAIPVMPLSYLYAIYKHHLSALELRANRLLGVYAFFALWSPLYVLTLLEIVRRTGASRGRFMTAALVASLLFVAAGPSLHRRFQALVDRHVFGVRHTPEEVIGLVAARIPGAFDRSTLTRVVVDEILPALLIRQSGLYLLAGDGDGGGGGDGVELLYERAVPPGQGPTDAAALRALVARGGIYLPPLPGAAAGRFSWVRLVLPLALQGEAIGAWVIGRRDPDDHFPAGDIRLLGTVASQLAAVLGNIRLYERAQQEIAQRKAAEEEMRRGQQQLLHAEKMEAIGRLSAGLAHDFNNCLGVILGYAELLLSDHEDDRRLGPHLLAMHEAGRKAAALTRELLAFARRQPVEPQVADLNEVVAGVERMLRRAVGSEVEVTITLGAGLPPVKIDPGRMEHVLVNLAVNARHAMPDGGRLTLRTAAVAGEAPHAAVPQGRWALLSVADTGVGMDAATLARVFEPFFTTRRAGEGTGLGLSGAYGFVKQSGGYIFADSRPGEGACFSIYLPAAENLA